MKPTQAPFKRIVLTCAVLAVALILFTEESRGVISVSVSANPLWTDTGITLNTGSQVSITASGSWYFGDGQTVGPEGASFDSAPFDRFTSATVHGKLIGYIGPDPFQGHAFCAFASLSVGRQANSYCLFCLPAALLLSP